MTDWTIVSHYMHPRVHILTHWTKFTYCRYPVGTPLFNSFFNLSICVGTLSVACLYHQNYCKYNIKPYFDFSRISCVLLYAIYITCMLAWPRCRETTCQDRTRWGMHMDLMETWVSSLQLASCRLTGLHHWTTVSFDDPGLTVGALLWWKLCEVFTKPI